MSSKLLNLYKFCQDFYNNVPNNEGIAIGLPAKEFKDVLLEAYALAPHLYEFNESTLSTVKELKFNTPGGILEIYEKKN